MNLLAISGSLRRVSASSALLHRIAASAPVGVQVRLFSELSLIPAFNPDLEGEPAPGAVASLREKIARSDAVLFSTPEYAHGIPGALKNALDWLVGSGELYEKTAAIVQPSTRGEFALASLTETLGVMGARLLPSRVIENVESASVRALVEEIAQCAMDKAVP